MISRSKADVWEVGETLVSFYGKRGVISRSKADVWEVSPTLVSFYGKRGVISRSKAYVGGWRNPSFILWQERCAPCV